MPVQDLSPFNFNFLGALKIAYLVAILIYGVFALVLIKQVRIMTNTLEIELELPLKLISYLHLLAVVLVFLFALTTL